MPKLAPPPLRAQNRSAFSFAFAMAMVPLARTICETVQLQFHMLGLFPYLEFADVIGGKTIFRGQKPLTSWKQIRLTLGIFALVVIRMARVSYLQEVNNQPQYYHLGPPRL